MAADPTGAAARRGSRAAQLRAQGLTWAEAGQALGVSKSRAQQLVADHDRRQRPRPTAAAVGGLSVRGIEALSRKSGRALSKDEHLADALNVAAAMTQREFLATPGVGRVTLADVGSWLAAHGRAFKATGA